MRKAGDDADPLIVVGNFTPQVLHSYRVGVPDRGIYEELLNSDSGSYGGSGVSNGNDIGTVPVGAHGRPHSLSLTLPPLGLVVIRRRWRTLDWFD
jgi:1,4-alpha-glucan branching enzyme